MYCSKCGKELGSEARFCDHCGQAVGSAGTNPMDPVQLAKRVRENTQISGIIWIVLGCLQILGCVTIVAGVWNLVMGIRTLQNLDDIKAHEPAVYDRFEQGLTNIIVSAVINLVLGGVIGVGLAAFDYYTRDLVLKNREAFN